MNISSALICGEIPMLRAVLPAFSSWSVASISMSGLMVSSGAPFRRRDSKPAPPPPAICDCSLRVRVIGIVLEQDYIWYWGEDINSGDCAFDQAGRVLECGHLYANPPLKYFIVLYFL